MSVFPLLPSHPVPEGTLHRAPHRSKTTLLALAAVLCCLTAFLSGCSSQAVSQPAPGSGGKAAQVVKTWTDDPQWRLDVEPRTNLLRNFRVDAALKLVGSGQPTPEALATVRDRLAPYGCMDSVTVWDVDLRQESHGFLNGLAVSWHGPDNALNKGKDAAAVRKEEKKQLADAIGKDVTLTPMGNADVAQGLRPLKVHVTSYSTEEEEAQAAGFRYFRVAATDFVWPEPQAIDAFVKFYDSLPAKRGWLYFHCHAGHGRTTTFMVLTEMLERPAESADQAIARQKGLGGADLSHGHRYEMLQQFHRYVQYRNRTPKPLPWSQWIAAHGGDQGGR